MSFTTCFLAGNLRNRRSLKVEEAHAATYRKDSSRHRLASVGYGYLARHHASILQVIVHTAIGEGKQGCMAFS